MSKRHFVIDIRRNKFQFPPTMMAVCPKCDIALILMDFRGIQVDYCTRCEGLWLDDGEIDELLRITGGTRGDILKDFTVEGIEEPSGKPTYLCPRCDRHLSEVVRRNSKGEELRLDRCPMGDGIWFDKNELQCLLESLPQDRHAAGALALLAEILGLDAAKKQ